MASYTISNLADLALANRGAARDILEAAKAAGLLPAGLLTVVAFVILLLALTSGKIGIEPIVLGRSPADDELLIILTSFLVSASIVFSWTSTQVVSIAAGVPSATAGGRETVIAELAYRAANLQRRSRNLLNSIVAIIIFAALFVVFAGAVTSLDVTGVKLVALAQADVRTAEDELNRVRAEGARARQLRLQRSKEPAGKSEDRMDTSEEDRTDDQIYQEKFESKKRALSKANEVLLQVKDRQFDDGRAKDQASNQLLLIQTSVTRFGVVLIIGFLVQILVNLYRYNTRLAAFYSSRHDALLLSKQSVGLQNLVAIMSPDNLDFGKNPRTPAEEAASLLEAWSKSKRRLPKVDPEARSNAKRASRKST